MLNTNLEFVIFVAALIANVSILITVYRYAKQDQSRILFSFFVLAQLFWITVNYFSFHNYNSSTFLTIARLTLFFATFHTVTFYLFVDSFLDETPFIKKRLAKALLFLGSIIAVLSLTPAFFSQLGIKEYGILSPKTGQLMPIFGLFVGFCVSAGFYLIIRRYRQSSGKAKLQWLFLSIGLIATFLLVLFFSFFNFVVLGNPVTVKFGHLYTLPFVTFTAYAMMKHELLNIKAVLAEIMVIILNAIIFILLINSQSTGQFITTGLVLIGTIIVGLQLIKGVEKEVLQRQELQKLSAKLADANEKLKALDLARAEFISIASHQLRTPPATIKWYMGALLSEDYGKLPPDIKAIIEKTARTNNSLISLIEDLLNVSRIERGTMEFLFEEVKPEALAELTFEQLLPIAGEKKLQLIYHRPAQPLPAIMADREKLRQVMNNMIDNSLKYTKQGSVEVSLFEENGNIRFQVRDTGKGINAEEAKNIFEKFKRGRQSIGESAGLGLGLYVAKIIIQQHKGKMWAESEGEGKGSTFIFTIPINNSLQATTLLDLSKNAPTKKPA